MADTEEQDDSSPSTSSAAPPTSSAPNSSWWGSWSQSWIDTVKEKSAQTMEMVKKDLNEFVEVIQGDTSVVMSETATKIKPDDADDDDKEEEKQASNFDSLESATKVVRKGMANLLSSVSELMQVPPDDSKEEVITIPDLSPTQSHYDRKQEKLHAIQIDPGTYCNEPEGLFSEWLEVFNLDDNKQVMSNMLVQNPAVRAIYTQLVPAVVSHTTFWQRYFYQVFLLESEERRREEIVARANKESNDDGDEESSGWGDDDEDDGIEVVSNFTLPDENSSEDFSIITNEANNETNNEGDAKDNNCETIEKINTDVVLTESRTDTVTCTNLTETVENSMTSEKILDEHAENISNPDMNTENSETVQNLHDETLEMSSEIPCSVDVKSDNGPIQQNTEQLASVNKVRLVSPQIDGISQEPNETSSVSSWMSIDDEIKVKQIKGEVEAKSDLNVSSADVSTDSNGVIVNKSDLLDSDDEDFELDDDVNEADVAKMVDQIKNMSTGGNLDDDDDWEKWE